MLVPSRKNRCIVGEGREGSFVKGATSGEYPQLAVNREHKTIRTTMRINVHINIYLHIYLYIIYTLEDRKQS